MDYSALINDIVKPTESKADVSKSFTQYNDTNEIHNEVAKNIELSEELRRNINLHNGNDAAELLEMTLKCISLMTGDTVFYSQNIKKLNNRS